MLLSDQVDVALERHSGWGGAQEFRKLDQRDV